jgi:chromosomal replication initiation ATPase DnaA
MEVLKYKQLTANVYQLKCVLERNEIRTLKSTLNKKNLVMSEKVTDKSLNYLLLEATAKFFGISPFDIRGEKRTRFLTDVRMFISHVLRDSYKLRVVDIGDIINRDHASVSFYRKRFGEQIMYGDIQKEYSKYVWFLKENELL